MIVILLVSGSANDPYALIIFNLGLLMLVGYVLGKMAEKIHLPNITGYLIGGLLLGPTFHFLSSEELSDLSIITDLALGFIAFQVGNELWLGKLKRIGKPVVIITLVQALLTTAVVTLLLLSVTSLSTALILGGIATATAPAPIMAIINKYRTKGPLTSTIVPIIGLDDAIGVIIFGIMLSLGRALAQPGAIDLELLELIREPLREIGTSILLGSVIGLASGFASKAISPEHEERSKYLDVIIITVLITVGAAMYLEASPILTPMIAGVFVANLLNKDTYVIEEKTIRFFVPPLMILFFTLSGARLSFSVLATVGVVGAMYTLARIIGKVGGAWIGASVVQTEPSVKKYLGLSMLPQSGVAIGLALAAHSALENVDADMASSIQNITLASALVFALIGPVLVKIAFQKTNEITEKE